jgi:hypothetical protein
MKHCTRCKELKPLTDFYNNKQTKDKKASQCKSCFKVHEKNWQLNNPESFKASCRKRNLKKKYGLTVEQYDEMFNKQNKRCACCNRETDKLVVDHNHTTGAIRELLCSPCNTALGLLNEDVTVMQNMSNYVRKHNGIL